MDAKAAWLIGRSDQEFAEGKDWLVEMMEVNKPGLDAFVSVVSGLDIESIKRWEDCWLGALLLFARLALIELVTRIGVDAEEAEQDKEGQ